MRSILWYGLASPTTCTVTLQDVGGRLITDIIEVKYGN